MAAILSDLPKNTAMYRYALRRELLETGRGTVMFVMLNPSTATRIDNDPTIRRVISFATDWGFRQLIVANVFALRSTNPAALRTARDPVGRYNGVAVRTLAGRADRIVAAWGNHGAIGRRDKTTLEWLRSAHPPIYHLGLTKVGQPRHPLYLAKTERPTLWG